MSGPAGSADPAARVLRLFGGKWIAAAVSTASSLGIPDVLADEPLSLEDLANRIACDSNSLERLLRVLQGEDLVRQNGTREFELTDAGQLLRSGQLGELAQFMGAPFGWAPWSRLPHAVRTGEAAFKAHFGLGLFDYLDQDEHKDEAALYHAAIDSFSRAESRALAMAFDFSQVERVVDVGGGRGGLLVDVLTKWPSLSGLLVERPAAVAQAEALFREEGIADRCETMTANFFEELPESADVLVLKHIIHTWDDLTSIELLRRCADVVGPEGTLLVIEGLLLPGGRANLTSLLDLEMLVLCGPGHERSKPNMRRLLHASGLRLEKTTPLAESAHLFVTKVRSG